MDEGLFSYRKCNGTLISFLKDVKKKLLLKDGFKKIGEINECQNKRFASGLLKSGNERCFLDYHFRKYKPFIRMKILPTLWTSVGNATGVLHLESSVLSLKWAFRKYAYEWAANSYV